MNLIMETLHMFTALAPLADRFSGAGVKTKTVNSTMSESTGFLVSRGAGATGTAKLTVEACDAVDGGGSNTQIPFYYKVATAPDAYAGIQYQGTPATGYTFPADANLDLMVEIPTRQLPEGKPYVRLSFDEVANDPVDGCVVGFTTGHRYSGAQDVRQT